jgi:glutamate racemase
MNTHARLGILDWGIGGVGVWRALRSRTRRIPVLYLSDSGFTPYGLLSRRALATRLAQRIRWFCEHGATGVVIACNAASTVLDALVVRESSVGVTGMIAPALQLVSSTVHGTIAVLGGARTIRSQLYRRGLERRDRLVLQRIAQPLSAHVEARTAHGRRCAQDLDRILAPVRSADAVLLACTHYPAIAPLIAARVPHARLLDPADAAVEHALSTFELPRRVAPDLVFTTGDPYRTRSAAHYAWGVELERVLRCE